MEGLGETDPVIRGRTADALEKVARWKPEWLSDQIPFMRALAEADGTAQVGMHLAMIFGHLARDEELTEGNIATLLNMLPEKKVFVRSWVISSLCIYARLYPETRERIVDNIATLRDDPSIAIRTRVRYAMALLTDEHKPFPKGWVKGEGLRFLEEK